MMIGPYSIGELLFSFRGRIGRQYWWLTSLAVAVLTSASSEIVTLAAQMAGMAPINPETHEFEPTGVFRSVIAVLGLVNAWISFALSCKRLHDRNRSGWWLVLQALLVVATIALVLAIFLFRQMYQPWYIAAIATGIATALLTLWLFVEMGFLKGTAGPNPYGPDPLLDTSADKQV
jgi:uncharacterized membrane protein YhaH (DUF805 family)